MSVENIINELSGEIMRKRARIIDDFSKAYIASRDDYSKDPKKIIRRLKLVERIDSPTKRTYWFELKRGRLK